MERPNSVFKMINACRFTLTCIGITALAANTYAATPIPSSADIDRVKPEQRELVLPPKADIIKIPAQNETASPAPEAAKKIHFILKNVKIEGATAFTENQLSDIYQPYINKDVTLDIAWQMAQTITKRYNEKGYFLSRAYVPAQEVGDGTISIKVVEGYIGEVKIDDSAKNWLTDEITNRLQAEKPANIHSLESQLLLLNDIPGYSFQATAEPMKGADEAAIRLTIAATRKWLNGSISTDNYGSRYLGPYETSLGVSAAIIPGQLTTVSGLVSIPADELRSISGSHKVVLWPDVSLEVFGGYSTAEPGYKLDIQDIKSKSVSEGLSLSYQAIRQRQENLSFKITIDGRDTNSDILGTPLTRDRVRAYRLNASYDLGDNWAGYNSMSFTFSHGIDGFGATDENDPYISRSSATPDFTKEEFTYSRLQGINEDFSALFNFSGQYSLQSLYSSEEFGYGGQAFGRAYDISEISGDKGIDGSIELRYQGIPELADLTLVPFGFYDIGKVWNNNLGQTDEISGSSAGLGLRFQHKLGFSGNVVIAQPLTKAADTPLYGGNGKNPRYIFQLSYGF